MPRKQTRNTLLPKKLLSKPPRKPLKPLIKLTSPNTSLFKLRLNPKPKKLRFSKRKLLTIKRKLMMLKYPQNLKNQLNLKLLFLPQDQRKPYQLQIVSKRKLPQKNIKKLLQLPKKLQLTKKHQKRKLQKTKMPKKLQRPKKHLKMMRLTKLKSRKLPQLKLPKRVFLNSSLLTEEEMDSPPNSEKVKMCTIYKNCEFQ